MKLHFITKTFIALGALAMLAACDDDAYYYRGNGAEIREDRRENRDDRRDNRQDHRENRQDNRQEWRDDRRDNRSDWGDRKRDQFRNSTPGMYN